MADKFELIVISPPGDLPGEVDFVSRFFEKGLERYHLRKPLWEPEQAEKFLRSIPEIYHPRIVIHSHFALADKYTLKGIHLNEENKKKPSLQKNHQVVSASFHSFEEVKAERFAYQYVFLSPIFDSISKLRHHAAFDLKSLGENILAWRRQNPSAIKIFALGGITLANIEIARSNGFSGVAVIGSVWNAENPVKAFTQLREAILV
jgi:thiamine-phosphate pyrophosphorylase